MTDEQKLHQWLKEQCFPCDYQRIEGAFPGVPDANIAYRGIVRWVELKIETNKRVLLRKEQYAWGMRRASHKDPVYVIAELKSLYSTAVSIGVWCFIPGFDVEPYAEKYVSIISQPVHLYLKVGVPVKSILFPGV